MRRILDSMNRLDENIVVQSIRRGLVMSIPVLMIGSIALILQFLPIRAYQTLITTLFGGALQTFFIWINRATFDLLALILCIGISMSYARMKTSQHSAAFGAIVSSVSTFMIFNGLFTDGFQLTAFGAQGMFTAIFSAVLASALFCRLATDRRFTLRLYTVGADSEFNNAISVILPTGIVIVAAFLLNQFITRIFGVSGFDELFRVGVNGLFSGIESPTAATLLYVFMSSLLWFFGIHGTNVLESVAQNIFVQNMDVNVAAAAAGRAPTEIFTKTFLDVFVHIGGCGMALSLLIAILAFGKHKNVRSLARMASVPMFFNINELMVFGLPIVFNATFLIPFLLTPLVSTVTSYLAISSGLVPMPVHTVEWVTPFIIGGYQATGSVAGSLLQVVNVAIGVVIYRWFVVRYEDQTNERIQKDLTSLIELMRRAEDTGETLILLELPGTEGAIAKMLAEDLRHVLTNPESFMLYYQPQFNHKEECVGAEALLRWNHPRCGMIYPPLLFGIARETNQLGALERAVFQMACNDVKTLQANRLCPPKISVNITAASLQDRHFGDYLKNLMSDNWFMYGILNIELTEQMSFLLQGPVEEQLQRIRDMGITFAIDDFSMGHTSLKYLQSNLFEQVKLDGSLVRDMLNNPRSDEIIASIIRMSKTMNFKVMAEYVETIEQRNRLKALGCYLYQGYLYSPAVNLSDLMMLLDRDTNDLKRR